MVVIAFFIMFIGSIICCHLIAQKRGANPVFWGVMGGLFGPLAIPFALMAKGKHD